MAQVAALSAALLLGTEGAWGYQETPISNGSVVKGTVIFSGAAPPAKRFELWRSPDRTYCGALSDGSGYRILREVAVSPEG